MGPRASWLAATGLAAKRMLLACDSQAASRSRTGWTLSNSAIHPRWERECFESDYHSHDPDFQNDTLSGLSQLACQSPRPAPTCRSHHKATQLDVQTYLSSTTKRRGADNDFRHIQWHRSTNSASCSCSAGDCLLETTTLELDACQADMAGSQKATWLNDVSVLQSSQAWARKAHSVSWQTSGTVLSSVCSYWRGELQPLVPSLESSPASQPWKSGPAAIWHMGGTRGYAGFPASRASSGASSGKTRDSEAPDVEQRRVNRAIMARMVRLVTEEGHEVISTYAALNRARAANLDLVEMNSKADPPVCRMLDYSRFRYEERKREKDHRKKQLEKRRMDDVKEVRVSSRTELKDLEMKSEMARKLLEKGYRVKCSVQFRKEDKEGGVGVDLLQQMLTLLSTTAKVDSGPRDEGHRAWAILRALKPRQSSQPSKSSAEDFVTAQVLDSDSSAEDEVEHVDGVSDGKAFEMAASSLDEEKRDDDVGSVVEVAGGEAGNEDGKADREKRTRQELSAS